MVGVKVENVEKVRNCKYFGVLEMKCLMDFEFKEVDGVRLWVFRNF